VGDVLGSGENMITAWIDPVHETIQVTKHPAAIPE
jgi:hypothetical protein